MEHECNLLARANSTIHLLTIKAQHVRIQSGFCSRLEMFYSCCFLEGENGNHVIALLGIGRGSINCLRISKHMIRKLRNENFKTVLTLFAKNRGFKTLRNVKKIWFKNVIWTPQDHTKIILTLVALLSLILTCHFWDLHHHSWTLAPPSGCDHDPSSQPTEGRQQCEVKNKRVLQSLAQKKPDLSRHGELQTNEQNSLGGRDQPLQLKTLVWLAVLGKLKNRTKIYLVKGAYSRERERHQRIGAWRLDAGNFPQPCRAIVDPLPSGSYAQV